MLNKEHCHHFQLLPIGVRLMYTGTLVVLGVGYLFAMIQVFDSHAGRDGKPGLSVDDLIIAYSGSKSDTRLESALKGSMANMLPAEEKNKIIAWVRDGVKKEQYASSGAEAIVEKRCLICHNGSNPHVPNLNGYDNISKAAELDTGMDIFTLVRVSHIHLFGITFIFFIVSSIFCHAYMRLIWLKYTIVLTPFVAILLDIGSWYLTKIYTPFAHLVLISGGFMGVSFAFQWVVSIYQMWFYKLPQDLKEKDGVVS
jgi:hypothetical protein